MARMFSVSTVQKSFFDTVRTVVLDDPLALPVALDEPEPVPEPPLLTSPVTPIDDVVSRDMFTYGMLYVRM